MYNYPTILSDSSNYQNAPCSNQRFHIAKYTDVITEKPLATSIITKMTLEYMNNYQNTPQ